MDESYTSLNSLPFCLYFQRHQITLISTSTVQSLDAILLGVFIIYLGGENCRQLLHRRFLPLDPISGHSRLLSISLPCQSSLHKRFLPLDPISGHSHLLSISPPSKLRQSSLEVKKVAVICWLSLDSQDVGVCHVLLGNLLFLYLFSPLKTALFPHFSHWVLTVLLRLVWSQKSCNVSLFLQLWEYLRATRKWESISLGLSGSVGTKGHAVADAVAEAPMGVARALLYIVRDSPSFLLHLSYKSFFDSLHSLGLQIYSSYLNTA